MTRSEFLKELRQALENDLSGSVIQENVSFYDQYITDEVRKGKQEEAVLQMLGDPWVLARTIIDAQNGTDKETVYEAGGNRHVGHEHKKKERSDHEKQNAQFRILGLDIWWKKLLLVLIIVVVIVVVVSIISGVISLLAPILIPVLILMVIVRVIGNRKH